MSNFENAKKIDENLLKYWGLSGAKACKSCRSRQELSNEYLLAKFGFDTAENEPYENHTWYPHTDPSPTSQTYPELWLVRSRLYEQKQSQ